ncbi:odorant receptor 131-2-like [Spinachia spinachia]
MLHNNVAMNNTTEVTQVMLFQTPVRVLLSMLPCLLFLYVNVVMLFALLRKPLLLESPRYVLFGSLLLADSLQLLSAMLLYVFAVTMIKMSSILCAVITLVARITVKISPLNLAAMSLERYVAICFPLRHVSIVTTRMTGVAIALMWTVGSLESFTQFFLFISRENTITVLRICSQDIFLLQTYLAIYKGFTITIFVSISMVSIYTYVAVMITVKSASSTVPKSSKPHKTMLLHLIQLCLCVTSTFFGMINPINRSKKSVNMASHIQYALFLVLIIFPKCLSPLIYGLRDHAFRHVFEYYFTFGFKTTVKRFSKS